MTTTSIRETTPTAVRVPADPGAEVAVTPSPAVGAVVVALPAERTDRRPVAALGILAALFLGFAANLAIVGPIRHQRDQRIAYAEFRAVLAEGTAPVSQVDSTGQPLKLGTPVAVLRVPSLGITEVIREGTTSGVLQSGPGHRRDTVLPGQLGVSVVMGRQAAYGGPFRQLHRLTAGDKITVVTGQNAGTSEHEFRVVGPRRAGDPIPPMGDKVRGRLTLVTGDGGSFMPSGVLRVDADLVSRPKLTPPRRFASADLPASEAPMGTDPGAWILVVLWAQALVLVALAVAYMLRRWGHWQSWIVGVPVLTAVGLSLADQLARLLPNLL